MSQPADGGSLDPERVEALHAQALSLDRAARAAFLAEACQGDPRLEQEILSLLAFSDPAEAFFTDLAGAVVSPALGLQLGRYRLTGHLGAGGMGTVYRAHDEQLDRVVALKFLPYILLAQPEARTRFLQEARAAAALEHPNVCSIHEIGETSDGRPFIAMACYDGETLQQRLTRGALSAAEAKSIALQLARGLGAAHARGIIHRDVKPGNVMLLPDGSVRLLDFGIAKVMDATMTGPGATPGTIAYMSPEQARGETVDARSDLWSLGVLLHEMLTGTRPFPGGNDRAVLQAIFHDQPASLPQLAHAPALAPIVERLLQKAPERRYQNTDELIQDLELPAGSGAERVRRWSPVGAIVLVMLTVAWIWFGHRPAQLSGAGTEGTSPTIAVLPFTVRTPELAVWREGMVDLLSMGLDGAAGIRTVNSRTLLARWHEALDDRVAPTLTQMLDVARQSHAQYAVVGLALADGTRIRVSADIHDVATGRILGPVQVEGAADSILPLVDRLGMQTLALILGQGKGNVAALDLASVTTSSLLALKAYLAGEDHYRRSEFGAAIGDWENAVRADSSFALAYLGLADAYSWWANLDNNGHERFVASLKDARERQQRLPPRERATLDIRWARQNGWPDALARTHDALRKYPDAADIWYELGEIYLHDAAAMGRPEQAESAFTTASELRPEMAPYRAHLVDLAFGWQPDSARIASNLEAYAALIPAAPKVQAARLLLALGFGDSATQRRTMSAIDSADEATAAAIFPLMAHPRFRRWRSEMDSVLRPRLLEGDRIATAALQFRTVGLMDGRIHQALAMIDGARTSGFLRYGGAFFLAIRGLPVPDSVLARRLALAKQDQGLFATRTGAVSAAGAAAQLGDWTTYNALMAGLRAAAARSRTAHDTTTANYWDWAVMVADAHGVWRHGRTKEALKLFERALPRDGIWFTLWSVGQLSLETGDTAKAERAFRALWQQDGTPAFLQLARILERTGRPAEARDAYQFVVNAWRDADPALQPLVDEARAAVTRLVPASS